MLIDPQGDIDLLQHVKMKEQCMYNKYNTKGKLKNQKSKVTGINQSRFYQLTIESLEY